MKLPWVSRERYEERCKEVDELKAERAKWLAVYAPGVYATSTPRVEGEPTHVSSVPVPAGRPTLMQVQREANLAAQEVAKTPGATIVRNIREGLLKGVNPIAS